MRATTQSREFVHAPEVSALGQEAEPVRSRVGGSCSGSFIAFLAPSASHEPTSGDPHDFHRTQSTLQPAATHHDGDSRGFRAGAHRHATDGNCGRGSLRSTRRSETRTGSAHCPDGQLGNLRRDNRPRWEPLGRGIYPDRSRPVEASLAHQAGWSDHAIQHRYVRCVSKHHGWRRWEPLVHL